MFSTTKAFKFLFSQGEEDFDLSRANEMRFTMMKYYETVDVVSKKIAALDTNDVENPPFPTALRLQQSIRQTAHAYLQVRLFTCRAIANSNCEWKAFKFLASVIEWVKELF